MSGTLDSQRGSEAAEQVTRTMKNHNYLQNIGNYQVLPGPDSMLGDGGFCSVYKCQHLSSASDLLKSSTVMVAVKLSTHPVHQHDSERVSAACCTADLNSSDSVFNASQLGANRKEWQAYEQLSFGRTAESQSAGIPSVYECE